MERSLNIFWNIIIMMICVFVVLTIAYMLGSFNKELYLKHYYETTPTLAPAPTLTTTPASTPTPRLIDFYEGYQAVFLKLLDGRDLPALVRFGTPVRDGEKYNWAEFFIYFVQAPSDVPDEVYLFDGRQN